MYKAANMNTLDTKTQKQKQYLNSMRCYAIKIKINHYSVYFSHELQKRIWRTFKYDLCFKFCFHPSTDYLCCKTQTASRINCIQVNKIWTITSKIYYTQRLTWTALLCGNIAHMSHWNLITLDPFTSFVLKEAVNNHYTAIQLQTMFVNFIISILKSQINTKL